MTAHMVSICLALLGAGVGCGNARAAGDAPGGAYWTPLPDERLADLRGGFDLDNGLKVSFGIERAVYINGALVTATAFNVGGLAAATGAMAPSQNAGTHGSDAIASAVIQNGQANLVQGITGANNPIAAMVIQNTMDNQAIRNVTVVNAAVNSLQILKTMNLGAALRDAIGAGIGPR